MSTAPPIGDRIFDDVVEALAGIAVVAGSHADAVVEEERAEGGRRQPYRIEVVDDGEENTAEGFETGHDEHTMTLSLSVDVLHPESDADTPARTYRRRAYGDVRRALLTDRHRGDLAQDTQVTGWRRRSDDSDGIVVTVTVRYLSALGVTNEPE